MPLLNKSVSLYRPLQCIQYALAVLWIYQGFIPKILFQAQDELRIWQLQGFSESLASIMMQASGVIEIIFGMLFFIFKSATLLHYFNIFGMVGLSLLILWVDPHYFSNAFNPFIMNVAMAVLSLTAIQLIKQLKQNSITCRID